MALITERTRASVSLGALAGVLTGLTAAMCGAVSARDAAMAEITGAVRAAVAGEAAARTQSLRHYVTREEWLEWQRREGARRDQQYYTLLAEIRADRGRRR